MLTTKGRYAVMAMVDIALSIDTAPVSLEKISLRQDITVSYLEQIFTRLRKKGLVISIKGPGGGYILGKEAKDITIAVIIEAVEESIKMTRCDNKNKKSCLNNNKTKCITHDLWHGLTNNIYNYLNSITIAQICSNQQIINLAS
jgi:Rrf2 family iron-sulfur cluster assembly transcriptional regulator